VSTEMNKALARRIPVEAISEGNLAILDEVLAPDHVSHADPGVLPSGSAAMRRQLAELREAFPDIRITIEDQLVEGDRVATRFRAEGTHRGPLRTPQGMTVPPTGRPVRFWGISIDRIAGGRIQETWFIEDTSRVPEQLGLVPDRT
jgi:predicted ester cyclase